MDALTCQSYLTGIMDKTGQKYLIKAFPAMRNLARGNDESVFGNATNIQAGITFKSVILYANEYVPSTGICIVQFTPEHNGDYDGVFTSRCPNVLRLNSDTRAFYAITEKNNNSFNVYIASRSDDDRRIDGFIALFLL